MESIVSVLLTFALVVAVAVAQQTLPTGPIAFNQLVLVDASSNAVIRLRGYDTTGLPLTYSIHSVPGTGSLYQLSQVFSAYGYDPKNGALIPPSATVNGLSVNVTGSQNRVYYARPSYDVASNQAWGTFTYTVSNGRTTSPAGIVTVAPLSGALVGSDFLLDAQGWTITGNKVSPSPASFEPYSRGLLLNHYVFGTDDVINVNNFGDVDQSLWYFQAPPAYLGNHGIAYQGTLSFTLGAFAGNFSQTNGNALHLVELECATCHGPVEMGIKLAFPLAQIMPAFDGSPRVFSLTLSETAGWLKDPQNSAKPWGPPTRCDMIQVLSRLSALRVLGDFTSWYESVALDSVTLTNTQGQLPLCALQQPDASVCLC